MQRVEETCLILLERLWQSAELSTYLQSFNCKRLLFNSRMSLNLLLVLGLVRKCVNAG